MQNIMFHGEGKDEKWILRTAQAYYQKQTAMQLERIANALEQANRQDQWKNGMLEKSEREEATWRIAFKLQQYRQEIEALFTAPTMPLSRLSRHLKGMQHIYEYYHMRGSTLEEAIAKTDYLVEEKHGKGFSVRLLREVLP